jgi:peptidoglycan hydrolase CwlO-like protein
MEGKGELLTLAQAALTSGRAVRTVRSWISAGHLQAKRSGTAGNAPLLVSRADLHTCMGKLGLVAKPDGTPPTRGPGRRMAATLHANDQVVAALQAHVADLQRQATYLLGEVDTLRRQLEHERERNNALQRELVSVGSHGRGIAGWLRQAFGGTA